MKSWADPALNAVVHKDDYQYKNLSSRHLEAEEMICRSLSTKIQRVESKAALDALGYHGRNLFLP